MSQIPGRMEDLPKQVRNSARTTLAANGGLLSLGSTLVEEVVHGVSSKAHVLHQKPGKAMARGVISNISICCWCVFETHIFWVVASEVARRRPNRGET